MNNYWKMNRIGFVNFWLYDEETFDFIDGKLLLRGQNGSGKSITTQSFIPFILDGDRTPSRLDPFGSSDRRMEYYFLGEDGKDDSTGYLFLEFKKNNADEYRTIAIGQRARRGKPMDFWGFVILDGRRIGRDIYLYQQTGSVKIPNDKSYMKKILGEHTPFVEIPGEYKKLVNKYLFGFERPEQYEQFIKLLVKVRAPKLSKEFKPTKVYDILNESLQTLTDEELRAMVDAMEKMDSIQENLDQLRRTFDDVKAIQKEYLSYNSYMLAKKGSEYLKKHIEVEGLQQAYNKKKMEVESLEKEQLEKTKEEYNCEEQIKIIEAELVNLIDTDMEEADLKLDQAKKKEEDAQAQKEKWDNRIQEYKSSIFQREQKIKNIDSEINCIKDENKSNIEELQYIQETLKWEGHEKAIDFIDKENIEIFTNLFEQLKVYENQICDGKDAIEIYSRLKKEQDNLLEKLEAIKKDRELKEQELNQNQDNVLKCQDSMIDNLYNAENKNTEYKLLRECLLQVEEKLRSYEKASDASIINSLLTKEYDLYKDKLKKLQMDNSYNLQVENKKLEDLKQKLKLVQEEKEIEPKRREEIIQSREALKNANIEAVPFYKAIEFEAGLSETEKARLEMQLMMMGILDALVVEEKDVERIRIEFPQWSDCIICSNKKGNSTFHKLVVSEDISKPLKVVVTNILSNILEEYNGKDTIYLGDNGEFRNGILFGQANNASEAEFVGAFARKRKREQLIEELSLQIEEVDKLICILKNEDTGLQKRMEQLIKEYEEIQPDYTKINEILDTVNILKLELKNIEKNLGEQETAYEKCKIQCEEKWQGVLKKCKCLPYGRTILEYENAKENIKDYIGMCREIYDKIRNLNQCKHDKSLEEDLLENDEKHMDDGHQELRRCNNLLKEINLEIKKYEEYLKREDIKEKAQRCRELKKEQKEINHNFSNIKTRITQITERIKFYTENEEKEKNILQDEMKVAAYLKKYFEEELNLNLVIQKNERDIVECAKEAEGLLKEKDLNKEPQDMLSSLHKIYQQNSSNLIQYGTTIEDCFEGNDDIYALRKRVRIVSIWNGKKLYLGEFYTQLKGAIEETELLIQKKDRELFEDILSQTVGHQLTERIAESRNWVYDMSKLMKGMDTSMGLSFSLNWKPKTAENDTELDTGDLEQILLRDKELLTTEDIERVAKHFRSKIKTQKLLLEEQGTTINYMELIRDALDYRKWFEFQMFYKRGAEEKKNLTNAAFNRFSGGEKAMAMYVPLFAAVNAQYKKATNAEHPKIIALDEAFAGVDDKNISSMFKLVSTLGFDYIMNSQALWGCFETVKGLKIADLQRPLNSQIVTVISYIWNGHERILDEG